MSPMSMELLAPAGSLPAYEAAIRAGADAVYVGAPVFNARALAKDFTFAEIAAMIEDAHRKGRKCYIAMNSLIKEDEMRQAVEALSIFSHLQPDALIIQDMGLAYLARRFFPSLRLHASTLMSVHNSLAARHCTTMGFERVVLARELTTEEIREIGRCSGADLEVFVHGAMCFSYSGLCMFSSLHGGKSSLRGQCVQPCRRRYTWQQGKGRDPRSKAKGPGGYLFSMHDLSGIDLLPALRTAGVCSLKIEGRLKSVAYVEKTVRAYRMALDSMDEPAELRQQVLQEAEQLLDEAMGRKRSSGYFLNTSPDTVITPAMSGNTGQLIGRVTGSKVGKQKSGQVLITVDLRSDVRCGDRLRLHDEASGERTSFNLRSLFLHGQSVQHAQQGQKVQMDLGRTKAGPLGGHLNGYLFRVDTSSGRDMGKRVGKLAIRKKTKALQPDGRHVEKVLAELHWRPRPQQSEQQGKKRTMGKASRGQEVGIWVKLRSIRALGQQLPVRAARFVIPLNRANIEGRKKAGKRLHKMKGQLIWALPPVIEEQQLSWYRKSIRQLQAEGFQSFQLGHWSQVELFGKTEATLSANLYGDYTLNILNSAALSAAREHDFAGVQFSLETDRATMASAITHYRLAEGGQGRKKVSLAIGMYTYGRPPLFTARLDGAHFRYQLPLLSPRRERFSLDRDNTLTHARPLEPFSLVQARNDLQKCGAQYLFMDLSTGALHHETAVLSILLRGTGKLPETNTGNFYGNLL